MCNLVLDIIIQFVLYYYYHYAFVVNNLTVFLEFNFFYLSYSVVHVHIVNELMLIGDTWLNKLLTYQTLSWFHQKQNLFPL